MILRALALALAFAVTFWALAVPVLVWGLS